MKKKSTTMWRHIAGILILAIGIFPLFFLVAGSLRPINIPPSRTLALLPDVLWVSNYLQVFTLVDILYYVKNSLFVALVVVPITVIFASWAGFAMAQLPEKIARWFIVASLIMLMIPVGMLLVGRFTIFNTLQLTNSYWPLILPAFMGLQPFYVLLFYKSFQRMPAQLFAIGKIEGLSPFMMWWLLLPLTKPVIAAVAALAFVTTWSDFLNPLVYLSDERLFTAPLGLRSLSTLDLSDYPLFLAGATIVTIPVLIMCIVVQRFFAQRNTS